MMLENQLESHLNKLCIDNPRYTSLNSTWTLNKRACSDLLKSVLMHYPHYSLHDSSHSDAVLSKIEMLLGDRIEKLSPTDTWLLLNATYVHDLGMVIQWREIEELWEKDEFKDYLKSLNGSPDSEFREAADFILNRSTEAKGWPLKAARYVSLINADYFRSKHAQRSRSLLLSEDSELHIDLGHNNLIQSRLIKLLGEICELHTAPTEKILELDYQTNGFDSDYAHPRFVAMLLRLGDLLDIDNNRFNKGAELSFGYLPPSSIPHKEKHNATTHLLVTPTEIAFRSSCPSSESYLEAQRFVSWLESEVNFLTIHWAKIAPKDLGGYAPCFEKKELKINGVESIPGVAGLKFQISQNKAFEVIEGSNLYEDRFVFIREVIQNAMDASKIQLWRDLQAGTYKAWVKDNLNELQPYSLINEIYSNYPITVNLSTLDDGSVLVKVMDRGTGIPVEAFKEICNVAVSNSNSRKAQKEIQSMPKWLRPTAGFGVGLQSVFLVADQFEIDTNTGSESLHAVFHSQRTGGHVQLQLSEKKFERGTLITIQFKAPEKFNVSIMGITDQYISTELDVLSGTNRTSETRVVEAINTHCHYSLFPIKISCEDGIIETHTICSKLNEIEVFKEKWDNRYCYTISPNGDRTKIWDMIDSTYVEFQFVKQQFQSNSRVLFKGIDIRKNAPRFYIEGLSFCMDLYGLDTKENITLDRSSFTQKGTKIVSSKIKKLTNIFIEVMFDFLTNQINDCKEEYKSGFSPFVFWQLCDDEQRGRIPTHIISNINDEIFGISKDGGDFYEGKIKLSDIMSNPEKFMYIKPDQFKSNLASDDCDYTLICNILNKFFDNAENMQIVTSISIESALKHFWIERLKIIGKETQVLLYKLSAKEVKTITVTSKDEKISILKGLCKNIPGMNYGFRSTLRYAIPAISNYKHLAVREVPYGVTRPYDFCCYYIVSPFRRDENENLVSMAKDQFVSSIIETKHFKNLVDYVKNNSVSNEEDIKTQYIELLRDYYDAVQETETDMRESDSSCKK